MTVAGVGIRSSVDKGFGKGRGQVEVRRQRLPQRRRNRSRSARYPSRLWQAEVDPVAGPFPDADPHEGFTEFFDRPSNGVDELKGDVVSRRGRVTDDGLGARLDPFARLEVCP